jgi:hypothetical protein
MKISNNSFISSGRSEYINLQVCTIFNQSTAIQAFPPSNYSTTCKPNSIKLQNMYMNSINIIQVIPHVNYGRKSDFPQLYPSYPNYDHEV